MDPEENVQFEHGLCNEVWFEVVGNLNPSLSHIQEYNPELLEILSK